MTTSWRSIPCGIQNVARPGDCLWYKSRSMPSVGQSVMGQLDRTACECQRSQLFIAIGRSHSLYYYINIECLI